MMVIFITNYNYLFIACISQSKSVIITNGN